ncbi:MAG: fused MFS/spermidine synthase [Myxococcaceae bacterium]
MNPLQRWLLYALFAMSGFTALSLQVVWQRILSLHAGVDLFSATTVVAAFMMGLGLGSLWGGRVADRLSPRGALLGFSLSKLVAGAYAWASVWVFYEGYRSLVPHLSGLGASFAFHFVLLVVPTTVMGLTLPFLARAVVGEREHIAPRVSRLYAANTLGAAAGAALTAYWMLGRFGFVGVVQIAAGLSTLTAVAALALWRSAPNAQASPRLPPQPARRSAGGSGGEAHPGWMWLYGLTGAAALGLEVLYFRIVDAAIRSNSYTFGHVLAIYLLLLAAGTAFASRKAGRVERPDQWFLWCQFGIGLSSLVGVILFVAMPRWIGPRFVHDYFLSSGFMHGPGTTGDGRTLARFVFAHAVVPSLLMGPPVFLMGASFPFIQALVAKRVETVGRKTGALLAANIAGNVGGTLLTGFVLLDKMGTIGTLRFWCGGLMLAGVVAAWRAPVPSRRRFLTLALGGMCVALVLLPSQRKLWAFVHGATLSRFVLQEDRMCVNAYVHGDKESVLYVNGAHQNGLPYDDFHILIGLFPALLHPAPERSLTVGFGAGSTVFGALLDGRIREARCVEVCGGEIDLLRAAASDRWPVARHLFTDPRARLEVGDGRKALLKADQPLDIITVDVLRPQSAYSGNVYSVEFYELVKSRLAPGGLFAQWVPTPRVMNSVRAVFSNVFVFDVQSYLGSQFLVASNGPIAFDKALLKQRFETSLVAERLPMQVAALREFIDTAQPQTMPSLAMPEGDMASFNRDLFPRDEYFLQWNR